MKVEIVGSFLPSDKLNKAYGEFKKGLIDDRTLKKVEDEAVSELVERQLGLGLARITSGELRRRYWDKDFWFGLDGITKAHFDSGHLYQNVEVGSDLIRINGRIGFNSDHPFFSDMDFLNRRVDARAVCMQCLPSPADLYLEILSLSDGDVPGIYGDSDSLLSDIANAYNQSIHEFYSLGCRSVQLDDTACGRLCQDNFTKRLLQGGLDLIKLQSEIISLLNDSLKGLPEDMETSLYLSGGDVIIPEWEYIEYPDNIMPRVFREVRVDKFFLPFGLDDDYRIKILRHIPEGRKVVLGLVDAHSPFEEYSELISNTVSLALEYVSPDNLSISPRTGFKLTHHQGHALTYEDQWRKLALLSEVMCP